MQADIEVGDDVLLSDEGVLTATNVSSGIAIPVATTAASAAAAAVVTESVQSFVVVSNPLDDLSIRAREPEPCLGSDHGGPNERFPRLVSGLAGDAVQVLHALSAKWYLVRVAKTGDVGLAIDVHHIPTSIQASDYHSIFFKNYEEDSRGGTPWDNLVRSCLAMQHPSTEDRNPQEEVLFHSLQRVNFLPDGTCLEPLPEYPSLYVEVKPLQRMCVIMLGFLEHHWRRLSQEEISPELCHRMAAVVFLHGISFLTNIGHQTFYSDVKQFKEHSAIIALLNRFALSFFKPSFAKDLVSMEIFDAAKSASFPNTHKCLGDTAVQVAGSCSMDNVYLLLVLMVLDGFLRAGSVNASRSTKLSWEQIAEKIAWDDTEGEKTVLLQVCAKDWRLGYYDDFQRYCTVALLVKNVCKKKQTLTNILMSSFVGQPVDYTGRSPTPTGQLDHTLSDCDLEAIWILIHFARPTVHDVASLLEYVNSQLSCTDSTDIRTGRLCTTACFWMHPNFFRNIFDYAAKSKERMWQQLFKTSDLVTTGNHPCKEVALKTIRQVLADSYFCGDQSDSRELLQDLGAGDSSVEKWAHGNILLAFFLGEGPVAQFPDMEEGLTVLCDVIVSQKDSQFTCRELTTLLQRLHDIVDGNPASLMKVVTNSKMLCTLCIEDVQPTAEIPTVGLASKHLVHDERTLATHLDELVAVLDVLASHEHTVSPTNPIIIAWWSYCRWWARECRQRFRADLSPLLEQLSRLATARSDAVLTASHTVTEGLLFSILLDELEWYRPGPQVLKYSNVLAPMLTMCHCTWKNFVSIESPTECCIPATAMQGFVNLRQELDVLQDMFANGKCTRNIWNQFKDNAAAIGTLLHAMDLPNLANMNAWSDALAKYKSHVRVLQWLQEEGVPDAGTLLQRLHDSYTLGDTTLVDFCNVLGEIDEGLLSKFGTTLGNSQATVAEYICNTLCKSIICRHYMAKAMTRRSATAYLAKHTWPKVITGHVREIYKQVSYLFRPQTPLHSISSIVDYVIAQMPDSAHDRTQSLDLVYGEIQLISASPAHADQTAGAERLMRLLRLQIVRQSKGTQNMRQALLKRVTQDDAGIRLLETDMERAEKDDGFTSLEQLDKNSEELYALVKDLQPCHWEFFRLIATQNCFYLFDFFRQVFNNEADFEKRLEIANTRLQGDPRSSAQIKTLLDIKPVMMAFYQPERTVAAIIGQLQMVTVSPGLLESLMDNLRAVRDMLNSAMESSFDRAKRDMIGLIRGEPVKARLVSQSNGNLMYECSYHQPASGFSTSPSSDPALCTEQRSVLKELRMRRLEELQLCLPYFCHLPETNTEEDPKPGDDDLCSETSAYINLSNLLASLRQLFESVLGLQNSGNTEFFQLFPGLKSGFDLNMYEIEYFQEKVRLHRGIWHDQLRQLRSTSTFLDLLPSISIGQLLAEGKAWMSRYASTGDGSSDFYQLPCSLMARITSVIGLVASPTALSFQMVCTALSEAVGSSSASSMLEQVINSLELHQSRSGVTNQGQVLCVSEQSQVTRTSSFASLLCEHFRNIQLCRAQFLFCSETTSENEIHDFFRAISISPGKKFAVCGVDRMATHCLAAVVRHQQLLHRNSSLAVQVFYLFDQQDYWKLWPSQQYRWLQADELHCASSSALQLCFRSVSSCWNQHSTEFRFPEVFLIHGAAGAGKSHYINHTCSECDSCTPEIINVSSHEDTEAICKSLRKLLHTSAASNFSMIQSVAFRVAPAADLDAVNQIFFELLWCHSLYSGRISQSVFSIPGGAAQRWRWYIELPDAFMRPDSNNTSPDPLRGLPLVTDILDSEHIILVSESSYGLHLDDEKLRPLAAVLKESKTGLGRPTVIGEEARHLTTENIFPYETEHLDDKDAHDHLDEFLRECGGNVTGRLQQLFVFDYVYQKWSTAAKELAFRAAVLMALQNLAQLVFDQYKEQAKAFCGNAHICNFKQLRSPVLIYDGRMAFKFLFPHPIPRKELPDLKSRVNGQTSMWLEQFNLQMPREWQELLRWNFSIMPCDLEQLRAKKEFVITEDFAYKLVAVQERKKSGKPLILEGETGTGKSFLLDTFTALLNYETINSTQHLQKMNRWMRHLILQVLWPEIGEEFRNWYAGDTSDDLPSKVNREDYQVENLNARCACNAFELKMIWRNLLHSNPSICEKAKLELKAEILECEAEFKLLLPVSTTVSLALRNDRLSNEDSCQLILDWLATPRKTLFRKMLVHPGITKAIIQEFVHELADLVRGTNVSVVGFFDEVNTASCLNIFKELIVDRTIDGKKPEGVDQMFFVAAINPPCSPVDLCNPGPFPVRLSERSEESERWQEELGLQYLVHPLPRTMAHYCWKYESLTSKDDIREYASQKIWHMAVRNQLELAESPAEISEAVFDFLSSYLYHSFTYCTEKVSKRFVSQRDIQRVFKLIPYFWHVETKWHLRHRAQLQNAQPDLIMVKCILQSIAMVFYLRLPEEPSITYPGVCRNHFDKTTFDSVRCDTHGRFTNSTIGTVLQGCVNTFVTEEHFTIPPGVALTSGLKENIFCLVACINEKIPLGIIGEPGSSKTLSYQIVSQNLRGTHSEQAFCKLFASVDSFFCQCSPDTTTDQLHAVFESAIDRQEYHDDAERKLSQPQTTIQQENKYLFSLFGGDDGNGSMNPPADQAADRPTEDRIRTNVTVFVDEAGLPSMKQNRMVMKVLHSYLDEQKVAFIALSNHWFDAANTNRMLTVFRSLASDEDLVVLAHGCIEHELSHHCDDDITSFIRGVCEGYSKVREDCSNWFHQRDLISLFRTLRRHQKRLNCRTISTHPDELLKAIEENFNGHPSVGITDIVKIFFSAVANHLATFAYESVCCRNSLEILMDLKAQLEEEDIGNTNALAMRFLMIVDDYGCDYALLDMLYHIKFLENDAQKTHVFQLSNTSSDEQELECTTVLAKIRQCLEKPCTVVLVNSPKLHGYLYELLNQSYQTISVDDKKCAYSNIAMKDSTFPCQVHEQFRCVVLLNREHASRERTPFLSRFAKFAVQPEQAVEYISRQMSPVETLQQQYNDVLNILTFEPSMEGAFLGCGSASQFRNTVACLAVGHVTSDTHHSFSVSSLATREERKSMVSSLLGLLPLERFLPVMESLSSIYSDLYLKAHEHSTIRDLIEETTEQARLSKSHVKCLVVCRSPPANLDQFLACTRGGGDEGNTGTHYMGPKLADSITVLASRELRSVLHAEQKLEEFRKSGKVCLVLCVDTSKGAAELHTVGAIKQAVDTQVRMWCQSDAERKTPRAIIVLLHSLLHSSGEKVLCTFLNGWQTKLVAVPNPSHVCPQNITSFVTSQYKSGPIQQNEEQLRSISTATLQWMKERTTDLAAEISSFLPWKSLLIFASDAQDSEPAQLFTSIIKAQASPDLRPRVIAGVFDRLPVILERAVEAFARRIMIKGYGQIGAIRTQVSSSGGRLSLVDMMIDWQNEELHSLLLCSVKSTLMGCNVSLLTDPSLDEQLIPKLSEFATTGEELETMWSQASARHLATPFFFHIKTYIQELVLRLGSGSNSNSIDSLTDLLVADPITSPLLAEKKFTQLYVRDLVRTCFSWTGSKKAVTFVCNYLAKWFESSVMVDDTGARQSELPFVHSIVFQEDVKLILVALLTSYEELLMMEADGQAVIQRTEQLLREANPDDVPTEFANLLVETLWSMLTRALELSVADDRGKVSALLVSWTRLFNTLSQHWQLRQATWGRKGSRVSLMSEVHNHLITGKGREINMMDFICMILESCMNTRLTRWKNTAHPIFISYVDSSNPAGISGSMPVRHSELVESLLNNLDPDATTEDLQLLRLGCCLWTISLLEGVDSFNRKMFEMIFLSLSNVDHDDCVQQPSCLSDSCATACLQQAQHKQSCRLQAIGREMLRSKQLDSIQEAVNQYAMRLLPEGLSVHRVDKTYEGAASKSYIIAHYQPSSLPCSFTESADHKQADKNVCMKIQTVFSLPSVNGFYRFACRLLRRGPESLHEFRTAASLKSGGSSSRGIGWVVRQCASTQIVFEASARSLAAYFLKQQRQHQQQRQRQQQGASSDDCASSTIDIHDHEMLVCIDGLAAEHASSPEWLVMMLWWILYLLPLECATSGLEELSAAKLHDQSLAKWCVPPSGMAELRSLNNILTDVRMKTADDFLLYQQLNGMRECMQQLNTAPGGSTVVRIRSRFEQTLKQSSPVLQRTAEACIFTKVALDFFLKGDTAFQEQRELRSLKDTSPLFKRALDVLFNVGDRGDLLKLKEILADQSAENLATRDYLIETLAVLLMMSPGTYWHTCLTDTGKLKGTYIFGASSSRHMILRGASGIDDFFQLTALHLPEFSLEPSLHQQSQPVLSLIGYILAALLTYSTLCWNAILLPEEKQWLNIAERQRLSTSNITAESTSRISFVKHCIRKIKYFQTLLPGSDVNVPTVGCGFLPMVSLQYLGKVVNGGCTVFNDTYISADKRRAAECTFRDEVCAAALRVFSVDLGKFLDRCISSSTFPNFGETHRFQLRYVHEEQQSLLQFMSMTSLPAMPSFQLPIFSDRKAAICCMASESHAIITELLANFPIYCILAKLPPIVKLYRDLLKALSRKLSFQDVAGGQLSLQKSLRSVGNQHAAFSKKLDELKRDIQLVVDRLQKHDPGWDCGDTHRVGLSLDTQLADWVNTPLADWVNYGGCAHPHPLLYRVITRSLWWQNRFSDVCQRAKSQRSTSAELRKSLECMVTDQPLDMHDVLEQENCATGLLRVDEHEVDTLISMHYSVQWQDEHWRVIIDLDQLERSLAWKLSGTVRRVKWIERDLRFFFCRTESKFLKDHLAWIIGSCHPLTDVQHQSIEESFASTDLTTSNDVMNLTMGLEKLARDLMHLRCMEPLSAGQSLYDLAVTYSSEGIAKFVHYFDFLRLAHLGDVLDIVRRHRDTEDQRNILGECSPILGETPDSVDSDQVLEVMARHFANSISNLSLAIHSLLGLLQHVQSEPTKPLDRVVHSADLKHTALGQFLDALRVDAGVSLAGCHYKWLLQRLQDCLVRMKAERLNRVTVQLIDSDPCNLVIVQPPPEPGPAPPNKDILVKVTLQQRGSTSIVSTTFSRKRTYNCLETVKEAIREARGNDKRIVFYCLADESDPEEFEPDSDDDGKLQDLVDDDQTELALYVSHKK
eukprot:scpid540/ scgid3780/ Putative uncharacterized transmembrane protein DDB_G0290641